MSRIEDRLDQAIDRQRLGESIKDPDLTSLLETVDALRSLEDCPSRDPVHAQQIRQAFLNQANEMPHESLPEQTHATGWKSIFTKTRSRMSTFAPVLILLVVVFGGTTATAFAAQGSLPSEPLYPIKTLVEDIRLALTSDPEAEVQLLMQLSTERMEEIAAMVQQGLPVPDAVAIQLQKHLHLALQECAQMTDDAALIQAMKQIHTRTQEQLRVLEKLGEGSTEQPEDALRLATQAMNNTRVTAEDALEDPTTFRLRQENNRSPDVPEQPEMDPDTGESASPGKKNGG